MPEFLVLVACVYQSGCSETASYYYSQSAELQALSVNVEKRTPSAVKTYVAPVVAYAAGGSGALKVYTNLSLNVGRSKTEILFKKEF